LKVYKATIWVDSIFHVAYSQAILNKSNYLQWYVDRGLTHYTHEGLGFSFLWHLMPGDNHWFYFALTQHVISIFAVFYFYLCLNKINESKWNLFFCFCLASSPYLMFYDSSYMTESLAKSCLIFSVGLSISKYVDKSFSAKKFIILMIINTLVISQFRLYWGSFIVILTVLALFDSKILIKSFMRIGVYVFFSLIILNINPMVRYFYTGDYTVYYSGFSKLEKFINNEKTIDVEGVLENEFKVFADINKDLLKNDSYVETLRNPDYSVPLYKYFILEKRKTPKEIDIFLNEIINKISIDSENSVMSKNKIRMFLDTSGLIKLFLDKNDNYCLRFSSEASCVNENFISYWNYLSTNHSTPYKDGQMKSWFYYDGVWDMLGARNLIYNKLNPGYTIHSIDCSGAICRKIENVLLLAGSFDIYLYSLIGCLCLVFLTLFVSLRMGGSLIMIIVINSTISSITMLSDARIMMPAFIIYGVGIAIFFSHIQKNAIIYFKRLIINKN